MKISVRYFGRFAVELGKFSEEVDMPDGATVKELIEFLKKRYPVLEREIIEVSIDGKYADPKTPLKSEVSVFPTISGG